MTARCGVLFAAQLKCFSRAMGDVFGILSDHDIILSAPSLTEAVTAVQRCYDGMWCGVLGHNVPAGRRALQLCWRCPCTCRTRLVLVRGGVGYPKIS